MDSEEARKCSSNLSLKVDVSVRRAEMEGHGITGTPTWTGGGITGIHDRELNFDFRQSQTLEASRLQLLIMHPTSTPILVWHIIGPLLLLYDIIMIPMKAFPLPDLTVFHVMSIVVTAYWSLDTARGFFTGFEQQNCVEMRPKVIAKRYLRTWFVLDASTCIVDWIFIVFGTTGMFNKFWRTSRAVQAWRILRLVRLVRAVKFINRISAIVDQVLSVQVLIAIRSINIAVVVCFSCHYMACYWFLVGDWGGLDRGDRSWLKEYNKETAGLSELYSTCFWFALAQSGFAPCNIYPTNSMERTYSCCASFFWIILVSVTINFFNKWLGQLRDMNRDHEKQRTGLRKYLEAHDVSRKLTSKVLRYFRANYRKHAPRVHEEDIDFLKDLPLYLKVALHMEVYGPMLRNHICFQFLGSVSENIPVMISHLAMTETHYMAGDTVFSEGNTATHVFHVVTGRLDYYAVHQNMRCSKLFPGDWAVEPALWIRWVLRGRLVSVLSSELVRIEVEKFYAIMQDAKDRGDDVDPVHFFGLAFCERHLERSPRSDLCRDFAWMRSKADEALIRSNMNWQSKDSCCNPETKSSGIFKRMMSKVLRP